MKMNKNVLIKDGKEIVIAASAAISLGVGTSLTHQVLAHAAEVSTTSTTPSTSSTTATKALSSTETGTGTASTGTTNSSPITTSATAPTTTTTTTSMPVASTTVTTGTSTGTPQTTPVVTSPTTSTTTSTTSTTSTTPSTTPATTAPTTTAPTTTSTTTTAPSTTTSPTATTPSTTSPTTVTPSTPTTSSSQYTSSDCFTWSTDSTSKTATVTGLSSGGSTITSINLAPTVTIDGVTYNVTGIGDNAFQFNNNLTSLILNDGLITIGKEAFYSNENLTSVILNDGLNSIGEGAFAYDSKLASVDFSKNNSLTTIDDNAFTSDPITSIVLPKTVTSIGKTAFAYNDALTTLTLPDSLQTLGDQAFASNEGLKNVVFDKALTSIGYQSFIYDSNLATLDFSNDTNLQSIGAGAFEYDSVSGDLTVPASVTSVGDQAFLSDQLTGLNYSGSNLSLGNEVFKYNRIVNIDAPHVAINGSFGTGIGGYQVDTIFTDPTHDKISDFFNINADGFGEQYLGIFGLTNGVTYSNGVFTIPTGTKSFAFNWSIGPEYNGQYNVVLNNPVIKAIDSVEVIGSSWSPADNFVGCTLEDGTVVPFSSMSVSVKNPAGQSVSTVDTNTPGDYQVTYSYGAYSTTVNVSVKKNAGTYNLSGTGSSVYNGSPQTATGSYQVVLSNGDTYTTQPGDVEFATPATDAGTYQVQLSAQGLAAINKLQGSDLYDWNPGTNTTTYVIEKLPITITADNSAKSSGQSDPTLTGNVSNGVTNAQYTVSRTAGETVGTYPITVTYTDAENPNYEITVKPATFTITGIDGSDYTMKVGDPTPTVSDFKPVAYDLNGPVSEIFLNLNGANLSKNGDYTVTLSTADGMTKQVVLHVTGGSTGGSTGPTTPTTPDNPDENDEGNGDNGNQEVPEEPEKPTTPTNPEEPGSVTPEEPQAPEEPQGPETSTKPVEPTYPSPEAPIISGDNAVKIASGKKGYVIESISTANNSNKVSTLENPQAKTRVQLHNQLPVSNKGRFPQTGDKTSLLTTITGVLLGLLSLIGIDLKHRKNNR